DNLDYENVVITADHGNALGEFGFYGHPEGIPLNCLREVPWSRVRSSDTGEYKPSVSKENNRMTIQQRLEDLGYI
ncbi:MAG: hypothetical protein ABEI86_03360, partial [Halobacteriaceae archaeon]